MSVPEITGLLIAVTGLLGAFVSYRLGQRGQHVDEKQQAAATKLQERIAAFDELGGSVSAHWGEVESSMAV